MIDPTDRTPEPFRHAGDSQQAPERTHSAGLATTRFSHAHGRTPEDSFWRAYEDDLHEAEARLHDDHFEDLDDDEHDDGWAEGLGRGLARRGSGIGHAVIETARRNPVGTALAAAGVALMFAPRVERDDVRHAVRTARQRAEAAGLRGRARARSRVAPYERRMREGADAAQRRMERARDEMSRRYDRLRGHVEAGTEEMSSEARNRVVAARMRAMEARDRFLDASDRARHRADHALRDGSESAREAYRDHPLLVGTLAAALGAAVGAALPRSRFEDDRLGDLSARLMDEAEEIYRHERARIADAARGALNEAREMATETVESARQSIPDGEDVVREAEHRLRQGAARVAEGAQSGARRETGG